MCHETLCLLQCFGSVSAVERLAESQGRVVTVAH